MTSSPGTTLQLNDPYIALHSLFRMFQRRNRFISIARGSRLSLAEGRALIEIGAAPGITPGELAENLNLTRPDLSKTVKKLEGQQFVRMTVSPDDRRSRFIFLRKKGHQALTHIDRAAEDSYQEIFAELTQAETLQLRDYFRALNDGFHARPTRNRPDEHPIRAELRRYTSAQGLMGSVTFSKDKINSLQWHMISEIANSREELTLSRLSQLLGVPGNTLSQSADMLQKRNLITRTRSELDARKNTLSLSAQGHKLYTQVVEQSALRFKQALSSMPQQNLDEFILLLGRTVHVTIQQEELIVSPQIKLRRYRDSLERNTLRTFFLKTAFEQGPPDKFPEILFGESSLCFGLLEDNHLKGAVEILRSRGTGILQNFLATAGNADFFRRSLLRHALESFFLEYPEQTLNAPANEVASLLDSASWTVKVDGDLATIRPRPEMRGKNSERAR